MPKKQAPESSLRPWIESWLRLLSPIDRTDGVTGRLLVGLRFLATGSVLLACVVIVWVGVAVIVCCAWQQLHQGRLGAALMTLLVEAAAAAGASRYRRWNNRRPDEPDTDG